MWVLCHAVVAECYRKFLDVMVSLCILLEEEEIELNGIVHLVKSTKETAERKHGHTRFVRMLLALKECFVSQSSDRIVDSLVRVYLDKELAKSQGSPPFRRIAKCSLRRALAKMDRVCPNAKPQRPISQGHVLAIIHKI